MHVVATAGHVDHGKSALVRALTGMEPDRFAEEVRRGMTLDLGFAWTALRGHTVAFVDVPGHERFVQTMLAGVGPAPAVLFVVAADQGWQEQSSEHSAILDALDVRHGVLAVTRCDLADPAPTMDFAQQRLVRLGLEGVEAVAVSSRTGYGLDALAGALARMIAQMPAPTIDGRVRMFVDRAFTMRGHGTVLTGTLASGSLTVGDRLELAPGGRTVVVRGLQSMGEACQVVSAVARVAVNVRGLDRESVARGSALLTPDAWWQTDVFDARLTDLDPADLPGDLMFHLGSAAVPARVRPFGEDVCRIRLNALLPMTVGDRGVLRDPSRRVVTGVSVLDVEPPQLVRRGASRARGRELERWQDGPDVTAEVRRRGAVTSAHLSLLGVLPTGAPVPEGVRSVDGILLAADRWDHLSRRLLDAVDGHAAAAPMEPGLSTEAARRLLDVPHAAIVDALVTGIPELNVMQGRIARRGAQPGFPPKVSQALQAWVKRLEVDPFDGPTGEDLASDGLTSRVLAAASRHGSFLVLPRDVVVGVTAPTVALGALRRMEQPFTLSQARLELGVTRRIAVPLLEYLDSQGLTQRVDADRRRVRDP